jgi:hypothetical protein
LGDGYRFWHQNNTLLFEILNFTHGQQKLLHKWVQRNSRKGAINGLLLQESVSEWAVVRKMEREDLQISELNSRTGTTSTATSSCLVTIRF